MGVEAGRLRSFPIEGLTVAADGDEPHRGAAGRRTQPTGDFEAVDPGQPEVDQDNREILILGLVDAILAAGRGRDVMSVQLEQQAQALARVVVVFDEEDAPASAAAEVAVSSGAAGAALAGKRTTSSLPRPSPALRASTEPA
jgi:hypothetical protein